MKKIIDRVTVTGADNSNKIEDLVAIQEKYPFVEWGILMSTHAEGHPRFPTAGWIKKLIEYKDKLNLSGHLCGKWVRDICAGENTFYKNREHLKNVFKRIQLNFHAYQHRIKDEEKFLDVLESFEGAQIIFQFDNVNNDIINFARINGIDAVPLFDTSGGAGVLPGEWPEALRMYSGYAGGLSPENLMEQMQRIVEKCGDGPIWIDAETHLRSSDDNVFDLDKVQRFLEIAKPWVIEGEEGEG